MTGSPARRVARLLLAAVLVASLTAGAALAFLSITPPKPVARRMLLVVSDRALLPPRHSEGAGYALYKIVGMYLEYTIAGKMARTAAAQRDLHGDVARIAFVLERAQQRMLSAAEVPHDPQDWPVLVAGVGYCDQVNAAICRILAHSFPRAQLFALYDPATNSSPHAIGRVWSNERHEWLYFDGFYRRVVFRKTADGNVEILSDAGTRRAKSTIDALPWYRLGGWVMSEYPSTYPMYVASNIRKRWQSRESPPPVLPPPAQTSPALAAPPPAPAAPPPVTDTAPPPPPPNIDAASHSIAKAYVRARADDLFGDPQEAKKEYCAVGAAAASLDPTIAILQEAARRFEERSPARRP
jgi:hypothetical protein